MACEPALMEQERWVTEMLETRPRLELSGPYLYLHWGEGEQWWLGLERGRGHERDRPGILTGQSWGRCHRAPSHHSTLTGATRGRGTSPVERPPAEGGRRTARPRRLATATEHHQHQPGDAAHRPQGADRNHTATEENVLPRSWLTSTPSASPEMTTRYGPVVSAVKVMAPV